MVNYYPGSQYNHIQLYIFHHNISFIDFFSQQHPAATPFCVSGSTGTPSVPPSAQTRSPPQTGSPTHKESASRKRSASWTRSSSKKRPASRGRSTSRRRSASRGRSPSRGRSNTRQESPSHPKSTATSRLARQQSRPSSHVVSVSHV